jgi:hypothetical protein
LKKKVNWTNPDIVGIGIKGQSKVDGRSVVQASDTLSNFSSFMENLKLDFEFDHAAGLLKYYLI